MGGNTDFNVFSSSPEAVIYIITGKFILEKL